MTKVITCEYDLSEIEAAMNRMAPKNIQKALKAAYKKGADMIKKAEVSTVKGMFPHGRYKRSGMLRDKKYGPLYKDLRTKAWSRGGGASVYMYSRGEGRQCVLYWLDRGTEPRHISKIMNKLSGRIYKIDDKGKKKKTWNRGKINSGEFEFFKSTANDAMEGALQKVCGEITTQLRKQWESKQQWV